MELTADQIVVYETGIHDLSVLEIYNYLITSGLKDSLPPIPVVPTDIVEYLDDIRCRARLKIMSVLGAKHIILDGNHRAIAHALRHEAAQALVISNESDLATYRRMVKEGNFPNFPPVLNHDFSEAISLLKNVLNRSYNLCTVSDRVERSIIDGRLPDNMARTYKRTGHLSPTEIKKRIKYHELALSDDSIPKDLRDNKEYLMARNKIPLCQVSKRLRDDDDVVFKAVTDNGCEINNASERLRRDRRLTELAVKSTWLAYKYIHPVFSQDQEIAIVALNSPLNRIYKHMIFSMLHWSLKENPDIIKIMEGC